MPLEGKNHFSNSRMMIGVAWSQGERQCMQVSQQQHHLISINNNSNNSENCRSRSKNNNGNNSKGTTVPKYQMPQPTTN